MYGATAKQVQSQLTPVVWIRACPPPLAGADCEWMAERLSGVRGAREAPRNDSPPAGEVAGTFNHRTVAGPRRLSRDSDTGSRSGGRGPALADTGAGASGGRPAYRYRNRLPLEIVQAFEREGFIWGGSWAHYDTMQFEFRRSCSCRCGRELRGLLRAPRRHALLRALRRAIRAAAAPAACWRRTAPTAGPRAGAERSSSAHCRARWVRAAARFRRQLRGLASRAAPGGRPRASPAVRWPCQGAQSAHVAVLDIEAGTRDLQQCA